MSIEVIYLGTGAAIPARDDGNCAYVLRTGDATVLIDCGPTILQQLHRCGISPHELTHIFFTHRHGDHALGYPMLMLWYAINPPATRRIPLMIGSELTLSTLDTLMQHVFGGAILQQLPRIERIFLPQFDTAFTRLSAHLDLRTVPMNHSESAPVLGARFDIETDHGKRVIAFTGDTAPVEAIVDLARNADLFMHDANHSATLNPETIGGYHGHSTAMEAARFAARAEVRHLALVHVDAAYDGKTHILFDEARREFKGEISMPKAGDRVVL